MDLRVASSPGGGDEGVGNKSPSTVVGVSVEDTVVDVRAEVRADEDCQSGGGLKVSAPRKGVKVKVKVRVRDGLTSELVNNQGRRTRVLCQHKKCEGCNSNTWELRSFDHTSCYVLIDAFHAHHLLFGTLESRLNLLRCLSLLMTAKAVYVMIQSEL